MLLAREIQAAAGRSGPVLAVTSVPSAFLRECVAVLVQQRRQGVLRIHAAAHAAPPRLGDDRSQRGIDGAGRHERGVQLAEVAAQLPWIGLGYCVAG